MAEADSIRACRLCGAPLETARGPGRPRVYCEGCKQGQGRAPTPEPRGCDSCGETFSPNSSRQRHCTPQCYYRKKDRERAGRPRKPGKRASRQAACPCCGSGFKSTTSGPSPGGWTRYCSRECYGTATRLASGSHPLAKRIVVRLYAGNCTGCGKRFHQMRLGGKYCGETCRTAAYAWEPSVRPCVACGEDFTADKWQRVCSEGCAAEVARKHRRVAKSRRRARLRGVKHDSIDPLKVFARDGWKCQLCGVSTPQRLRGTMQDRAPELDHVVPLAAGGSHTWGNVQCACRRCNNVKGANPMGQLGLPLAA